MAWSFIDEGGKAEVTSGDCACIEPIGAAEGDLLVACIGYRSNAAFTLPADWALVATQQSSGNTVENLTTSISSAVMAYIVRGGSAPSYVFTRTAGDLAVGVVVCYRGNHATPYQTGSANTLGTASVTNTTTTITTSEDGELLVCLSSAARNSGSSAFDAATGATTASGAAGQSTEPPASNTWIQRVHAGGTVGADGRIGVADAIMTTAGATGTVQATIASSARHAMIVGAFKLARVGSGLASSLRLDRLELVG